jgi:uncharacterized protein (TIGR00369 family)
MSAGEAADADAAGRRGIDLVRQWLGGSPFVKHLGMEVLRLDPDIAEVRLPFDPTVTTIADVVHGGALSSLIDTAATAAAWSGAGTIESARGTTVGLTVSFVGPARGEDVAATARVARRGKSLVFCDVDVTGGDGALVAKGLVTYKLG